MVGVLYTLVNLLVIVNRYYILVRLVRLGKPIINNNNILKIIKGVSSVKK